MALRLLQQSAGPAKNHAKVLALQRCVENCVQSVKDKEDLASGRTGRGVG